MKRKLSPDSARIMTTLQLDPLEKQLKHLLLDVAAHIDKAEAKEPGEKVILRWAGGWVRDKLLGRPSHDIDVAINSMTGEVFGNELRRFCESPENVARHNLQRDDIGRLHKIAKNPEKSKQLETATVKLFGLDVDFVNLRTEKYTEDSRNPQVEFGTAEEDALRRDATVNALFYNIHTGEVEDFVGGVPDMRAGIIRTPMDPFQTFMDDPLRVLRLVRFASRLGFSIAPPTKEFMGNARVLGALRAKIREHPRDAVRLIDHLGLYHTIFTDPVNLYMPQPSLEGWSAAYGFLHDSASDIESVYDVLVTSDEARYYTWILACLAPFARVPTFPSANPKKQPPLATVAVREGIKAPGKLSDLVTAAARHREEICELKSKVCSGDASTIGRDRLGMAIRGWEAKGGHWRLQVLFAILFDVMVQATASPELCATSHTSDNAPKSPGAKDSHAASTLGDVQRGWKDFLDQLQTLDLMDAPSMKPLVDGRRLLQALDLKKPGKWMSSALDICIAWQFRNPGESDPAGAIEEVRQRKEELGIPA
ncbi:CCA tRNA nucleotidyltransferase, mitochondrial [Diaporthe australafricana]|uniref:CCA tRNA nucleotidyltransferase, mitochondrial n=1 Tax=Diaporthe australafricana TaxID=127596 RepID=A0ABR3X1T1_9PEZI